MRFWGRDEAEGTARMGDEPNVPTNERSGGTTAAASAGTVKRWHQKTPIRVALISAAGVLAAALIAAAVAVYNGRDRSIEPTATVGLKKVGESEAGASVQLSYHVEANDTALGPVRLMLAYPATGSADQPGPPDRIVATLNRGEKELATGTLRIPMTGAASALRLKTVTWDNGTQSPTPPTHLAASADPATFEYQTRVDGLVISSLAKNQVADGRIHFTVTTATPTQLKVNTYVAPSTQAGCSDPKRSSWNISIDAKPGDMVDVLTRFENQTAIDMGDMVGALNLPDYLSYVNGSTWIVSAGHPTGIRSGTDNLPNGGINVGTYAPLTVGYVCARLKIHEKPQFDLHGTYGLTVVGLARPKGENETYNTAKISVDVP